ncbi:MAG: hypothetical protein AUJ92_08900 [Armatimonadetes bacterium CG2_30_59_28]|nr:hypothetical protein [Armatimonadota bacterium]OIO94892.1 MAG: hypothetical protein AUJ92_08900 [Armatimonadetes bacterium CG2_30_59_28]PIU60735.1 MAG: hypothetical protein COS85_22765 [Armatimonadetes bacterium CG07_land_8_20_14_0_80_59_28]PIX43380.1 MAG: hypothetical protein COZ56_07215 [Armatimonadetes bacterium CG_4_8_14_3_um_filter_58_9]PIY42909.1 MAG: hypothetical protein COZ05_12645 [Armatimonadetes bacterium CG_4_10_14_3_um_filter_59_10]
MYDLQPKAVFAHKRVYDNPIALKRMERMLEALGIDPRDVPTVDLTNLDEIIEVAGATESLATEAMLRGGHGRVRQGHLKLERDPVLVFNTFVWDEDKREQPMRELRNPQAAGLQRLFCGVGTDFAYSQRELLSPGRPYVCQGGWGIHTLRGCFHKCDYCCQGFLVSVMLDLEDFCVDLSRMFRERPEQLLYRYDLYSDILAFEPEYGATEALGECFAEHEKYLLLYTRSNNVEYLADLPYQENVLINWTLSMQTQAEVIERDSPSLEERIEAMRFCQEHGYKVRAGFSPIIPIATWRRETSEMLELLFSKVQPEVLRGWVLAMMEAYEFEQMFDTGMMDQKHMTQMREAAEELAGQHIAPFPLDVRAEIYEHYLDEVSRISPETPFALCTEHPRLWEMLKDKLCMSPGKMFCCCGGLSRPGGGAIG